MRSQAWIKAYVRPIGAVRVCFLSSFFRSSANGFLFTACPAANIVYPLWGQWKQQCGNFCYCQTSSQHLKDRDVPIIPILRSDSPQRANEPRTKFLVVKVNDVTVGVMRKSLGPAGAFKSNPVNPFPAGGKVYIQSMWLYSCYGCYFGSLVF